ncbi:hypothetical protein BKA62DRAFT_348546 [Auriculariales sp. MPI-PUGE-AT-0066]|nr:hypothetical protein BKA62DRAFT_348546 [Auriculariales sp. MPI-PUGE-AT-0066]
MCTGCPRSLVPFLFFALHTLSLRCRNFLSRGLFTEVRKMYVVLASPQPVPYRGPGLRLSLSTRPAPPPTSVQLTCPCHLPYLSAACPTHSLVDVFVCSMFICRVDATVSTYVWPCWFR